LRDLFFFLRYGESHDVSQNPRTTDTNDGICVGIPSQGANVTSKIPASIKPLPPKDYRHATD
jgi:hypothetical protein